MRRLPAILAALALTMAAPVDSLAVTKNILITHYAQETNYSCVPASVRMELVQSGAPTPPSQSVLYTEGRTYISCPGEGAGLDPKAWAYELYLHRATGHYYDHYKYTSAYGGTRALLEQLWYYNEVSGALVNAGHHAMIVQGADTSCDPTQLSCDNTQYTINWIYVNDPWYGYGTTSSPGQDTNPSHCQGTGGRYTCGLIGLPNDTMISYTTWSMYYYTPWAFQDCSTWNNYWVAVLRKDTSGPPSLPTSGPPSDQPQPGHDWPEPHASPSVYSASLNPADLDVALAAPSVVQAARNRPTFAAALAGSHVRNVVPVRSIGRKFPDYYVAVLAGNDGARGLAMFTPTDHGPVLAELATLDSPIGRYPYLTPEQAVASVTGTGTEVTGPADLVWAWSEESESPFLPLYRVPTTAGERYVDQSGVVFDTLHLQ